MARPDAMDTNDELTTAHEQLRLATAAYAEMISAEAPLQTEAEYNELLRRQVRAQAAWERFRGLQGYEIPRDYR